MFSKQFIILKTFFLLLSFLVLFRFPYYIPHIIALNIGIAILESANRNKIGNALLGVLLLLSILNIKWNEENPSILLPFLLVYSFWNIWFCSLFTQGAYRYSLGASNVVPLVVALLVLYGKTPEKTLFFWGLIRACIVLTMIVHSTKEII